MPFKVDLHIHTNKSDGALSPVQIVNKALKYNIPVISITDHDTVEAIPEAVEYGKKLCIEVIPGIETSSSINSQEIHLLSYFFDINNKSVSDFLTSFTLERKQRALKILTELQNLNININIDDVREFSGNSPITRPHIAQAMVKKKYVNSFGEAFYKFIGDNGPANVKKTFLPVEEVTQIFHSAGGLIFLAHPVNIKEDDIITLIDLGIDGLETVHPMLSSGRSKTLKSIAEKYSLPESGGSDFHGGEKGDESNFGKYYISQKKLKYIKNFL